MGNQGTRIATAIVADRRTTAAALEEALGADLQIELLDVVGENDGQRVLAIAQLQVLIVNLSLVSGMDFIRAAKGRRPDLRILALARQVDEDRAPAARAAGADVCLPLGGPDTLVRSSVKALAGARDDLEAAERVPSEVRTHRPHLSPREAQVLRLVLEGYTNEEIAHLTKSAVPTVRTHLAHLYAKLGVNDRVSAAVYALTASDR